MRRRYTWRTGVLEGVLLLGALAILFPVYLVVVNSVRGANDYDNQLVPPHELVWGNFATAWSEAKLGNALVNSLIVTGVSVLLLILVGATAAYPLARLTAGWSKLTYLALMTGLLLPFQLALIPLYSTFRDLGLLGNQSGLIVLYTGQQAAFSIFLYTEFLRSVPLDYEEAAAIDGCGRFQTFWHVTLPLLAPVTGTVGIMNAVLIWNDFYAPLLYLSGSPVQTIPLAVYQFVGAYDSQWGLIFSSLILGSIPILAAFLLMQKAVFRGYATGIKG